MPNPPNLPERESRYLAASVELRAAADSEEPKRVFGYAAKFNSMSENLGSSKWEIREMIEPGAFDDVLQDDVRALWNHDPNHLLARSKNGEGSLRLGVDETGLWYEFEAPDTQAGRDLLASLKRGDVDQSSFSFTVAPDGQKWEEKGENDQVVATRTITKVKRLYDVSPVTYPAYPDASVALRSLEQFREERGQEEEEETPEVAEPTEEQSAAIAWAAFDGFATPPTNQTTTD